MLFLFDRTPILVFEGHEKDDFWSILGGKAEYASEKHMHVRDIFIDSEKIDWIESFYWMFIKASTCA